MLDHATPIGEVIIAAPTYKKLIAEFRGVESHAGMQPEDGRSAIAAATAAIATMDLGRLDAETTANIGVIDGGTAPNVVAGRCHVEGEARALDSGRAEEVAQTMVDACSWAAGEAGVDVDLLVETYFRGYRIKPSSRPLAIARAALEGCGVEPIEIADRRRQRRQRAPLGRLRRAAARQRHRGEPHARRVGLGRGARDGCSTSAPRSSPRPGGG